MVRVGIKEINRVIMATEIKGISNLSAEELDILFTSLAESYSPIEINERVYIIPQAVNDLIDSLYNQLERGREGSFIEG